MLEFLVSLRQLQKKVRTLSDIAIKVCFIKKICTDNLYLEAFLIFQ